MNKTILLTSLFALTALAGCLNGGPGVPSPHASFDDPQPDSVTALEPVAQLMDAAGTPFPSAAGIWPYGDYVFGSGLGAGFFIADISDPVHPELLYNASSDGITAFSRDADVVAHGDRLTLVLATQNDGMHLWDVSDPRHPEFLSRTFDETIANHNVAVVPGTELVFNSRSGGEGSTNDLVDVSDPANPVRLGEYGTHGCHDISFFGSYGDAKFRAYCAGIQRTEIWDLDGFDTDAPDFGIELLGTVEFGPESPIIGNPAFGSYPTRTLHHLAIVNEDASVLIVGDEFNGGGRPGSCLFYDATTGLSQPVGALWFYDLSDETAPRLQGWITPPAVVADEPAFNPEGTDPTNPGGVLDNLPSCTAHFGTLVPGEDKLVMSWYYAGVVLIDFSDPAAPTIVDQYQPEDVFTWDSRVHNGYVFTGDIHRGMDVLRLA